MKALGRALAVALAAAFIAVGRAGAIAGALPQQADSNSHSLRSRRPDRRGGPALRRSPAQIARAEHPGREQARRVRHPRDRGNGPRQAGRLHHHDRQHLDQLPDTGPARPQDADQLRPRRADHRAHRRRAGVLPRNHDEFRAQDLQGVHRLRQEERGALRHQPASAPISTSTPRFWPSAPVGCSSCTSRSRTAAPASSRRWPAATSTRRGSTSPTRSA